MFASQINARRQWIVVVLFALFMLVGTTAAASADSADGQEVSAVSVSTQQSNGFYYTVQWGDYLSRVAQRYGTTVQAILWANPQIYNPNHIYYGQVIFIPQGPVTPPPPPPPPACRYYHYVTYGQNLSSIAAWYGVSPWAIAQANGLYNLNYIYAGTYLCIP